MRMLLVGAVLLLTPTVAMADALPECPEGQHMVTNPVEEGAMHHAGGTCVDDEGGGDGGCAVHGSGSSTPAVVLLVVGLCLMRRRRRLAYSSPKRISSIV